MMDLTPLYVDEHLYIGLNTNKRHQFWLAQAKKKCFMKILSSRQNSWKGCKIDLVLLFSLYIW